MTFNPSPPLHISYNKWSYERLHTKKYPQGLNKEKQDYDSGTNILYDAEFPD